MNRRRRSSPPASREPSDTVRALGLLLLIPFALWLSQTVLLWRARLPWRARLNARDLPRGLKRINRVVTGVVFAAVLLAYPLLRGLSPATYYARFFPLGARPRELALGAGAAIVYLSLLYLAWVLSDNVRFRVRHDAARLVRRLLAAPVAALVIALTEEALFRGILLAELLESWDPRVSVVVGIVVFASAHYVRSAKRYWTFPGHLVLATLFCLAFVFTRALWLPIGLHAGGVLVLLAVRPFVRYTGPAWLVGASIFSYAGAAGLTGLGLLIVNLWLRFGGPT